MKIRGTQVRREHVLAKNDLSMLGLGIWMAVLGTWEVFLGPTWVAVIAFVFAAAWLGLWCFLVWNNAVIDQLQSELDEMIARNRSTLIATGVDPELIDRFIEGTHPPEVILNWGAELAERDIDQLKKQHLGDD